MLGIGGVAAVTSSADFSTPRAQVVVSGVVLAVGLIGTLVYGGRLLRGSRKGVVMFE